MGKQLHVETVSVTPGSRNKRNSGNTSPLRPATSPQPVIAFRRMEFATERLDRLAGPALPYPDEDRAVRGRSLWRIEILLASEIRAFVYVAADAENPFI